MKSVALGMVLLLVAVGCSGGAGRAASGTSGSGSPTTTSTGASSGSAAQGESAGASTGATSTGSMAGTGTTGTQASSSGSQAASTGTSNGSTGTPSSTASQGASSASSSSSGGTSTTASAGSESGSTAASSGTGGTTATTLGTSGTTGEVCAPTAPLIPATDVFSAPSDYAAGTDPRTLFTADMNGDCIPDLIDINDDGVSVLLGDGHGNLTLSRTLTFASTVTNVLVGDFNDDGITDLLVGTYADQELLTGDGAGGLSAPTVIASYSFAQIAGGDLNGDGHEDLIIEHSTPGSMTAVLTSYISFNGRLVWLRDTPLATPATMMTADFNLDHKVDMILIGNLQGSVVPILMGNGDGTFVAGTFNLNDSTGINPCSPGPPLISDLNSDGIPDLYLPGCNATALGYGDGGFAPTVSATPGNYGNTAVITDFDCDGVPDIFIAGSGNNPTGIFWRGLGDGTFTQQQGYTYVTHSSASALAAADFDQDGYPDVVSANSTTDDVTVLLGNAAPTPVPPPQCYPGQPYSTPWAVPRVWGPW